MKEEKKDIETIEMYLRGELGEKEMAAVEERLAKDKDFSNLFEELKGIEAGISKSILVEKLDLLKDIDSEMEDSTQKASDSKTVSIWKRYLLVAASLALLMYLGWIIMGENSGILSEEDRLFAENFEHIPDNILSRNNNASLSSLKAQAYEAYSFYDYGKASGLLELVFEQEQDTMSAYFAAISYLYIDNPDKARYFIDIVDSSSIDITNLPYLKALVDLRDGNIEKFNAYKAETKSN